MKAIQACANILLAYPEITIAHSIFESCGGVKSIPIIVDLFKVCLPFSVGIQAHNRRGLKWFPLIELESPSVVVLCKEYKQLENLECSE